MTNDKMIRFVKRWRELERQQKDLDFQRSELARDIRAEFESGEIGDAAFVNWCVLEFGVTTIAAKELLTRAIAAGIVPDERAWKMIGGYRAIRPLQVLPRREQIDVLEAAKASGRAPINVMKDRGLIASPSRQGPNHNARLDAAMLAQFIERSRENIPADILEIVTRYRSFMKNAA